MKDLESVVDIVDKIDDIITDADYNSMSKVESLWNKHFNLDIPYNILGDLRHNMLQLDDATLDHVFGHGDSKALKMLKQQKKSLKDDLVRYVYK